MMTKLLVDIGCNAGSEYCDPCSRGSGAICYALGISRSKCSDGRYLRILQCRDQEVKWDKQGTEENVESFLKICDKYRVENELLKNESKKGDLDSD